MRHFLADFDGEFLARKYGTPLYIYDIDSMQKRYLALKDSFAGFKSLICYALKANSNLSIVKTLANMGSGADCVSLNEVRRAILAGIPRYKIIFSGVGKEDYEILEALKLGILFINVESKMELLRIEKIVKKMRQDSKIIESKDSKVQDSKVKSSKNHNLQDSKNTESKRTKSSKNANFIESTSNESLQNLQARISIRVNPDVNANTHPYISTGLHENKFGLDIESAKELYLYAHKSEFLNPVGIHYHIGSQILDSSPLLEATDKIWQLAKGLKAANIDLKFFDIGGGFGINYKNDKPFDITNYIGEIIRKIDSLDMTCITEPGRFIMGNAGAILTRVIGEKRTAKKRFVIIDCAMNDLIRPSLYHAYHNIVKVTQSNTKSSKKLEKCDVVGAICESGDYIAKDREMPKCASGELLLIESCGAYGFSMSSNYNSRLKPAQIALYKGKDYLIQERETFESSVSNELTNLKDFKEEKDSITSTLESKESRKLAKRK